MRGGSVGTKSVRDSEPKILLSPPLRKEEVPHEHPAGDRQREILQTSSTGAAFQAVLLETPR